MEQRRVLVVDDNCDLAEALALGLGHLGYLVRTASDGLSGLAAAIEFRPHIALIDLVLPLIDGFGLAERLRDPVFERPRLIALTAHSSVADRTRAAASGFDHHVVKPASLAKLDALMSG